MTMNRTKTVRGVVTRTEGDPNPHSFWIKGEDGIEYFAHLGDLTHNSGKLLRNENIDTEFLQEGDNVKFIVWDDHIKKAFHIVKLESE
jgi:hypothetical protein